MKRFANVFAPKNGVKKNNKIDEEAAKLAELLKN